MSYTYIIRVESWSCVRLLLNACSVSTTPLPSVAVKMSIVPGLNDDCVARTLHFLDTSSLSSMAATSRAALILARVLVRDVCLESDEHATSFLTLVITHSLEYAMRTLCLAMGGGSNATPWPVLVVVSRTFPYRSSRTRLVHTAHLSVFLPALSDTAYL
ncbi:hypothetical protein EVG20_g9167 [Dentipellis fragilis]|uniref:Uncharacterized protein n=1 Tax=Dentipellis fragilis TaxID=205917 RepID=A0A4Y9Y0F8_9AGAM|nr:hypothetical protein EVG20_g9167 [Dentipellis fragilis]